MTITIADLQARVTAVGVQETTQQVKAVGDAATQTTRALQIMAEQMSKAAPTQGTPAQILELLQRTNVQPTAAAMAQAAQEMQRTAAAAQATVQPVQLVARAAAEHATAAANGAKAAQSVADGWKFSESSVVRFGAGLAGISLGISLVAGAARLVHDAIESTVTSQLDWERSLVQVRALYGDIAPRVVALSQAQAALPGVTATQQQLLQANLAAGFLTTRYGVSPALTGTLTTQAARLGGLFYPGDQGQQGALLQAVVDYARTGGGAGVLEGATGQAYDPLTLARRLGFSSEAALQALTPQQLAAARGNLEAANLAQANIQGSQQSAGLLAAQRDLQHNVEQLQGNLQTLLEGGAPAGTSAPSQIQAYEAYVGLAGEGAAAPGAAAFGMGPSPAQEAYEQQIGQLVQAINDAKDAYAANSQALADNQKQLDDANAALAKFGVEAGSSAARLLSFTGSLEDTFSIARGDVATQAQAAVAQRGRSAIPAFGTPAAEIGYQATQTAYQQAYQNFVANQAQQTQDNAIRDYLSQQANQQGPGLDAQRTRAQRALDQAQQAQPIQQGLGEAQRTQAQVDLAAAARQAQLDQISLDQRTRHVQMLRDTVELRLRDNSLQQDAIRASADVIRAQQAALPSQQVASSAQYQQNLAQAYAQQRIARVIQGQSVAGLPTLDQLIQMNVGGQLAAAENAPNLVRAQRGVEVAQQGVTRISLEDALVQSNIRLQEVANDAKNLQDIPRQTQLNLEVVEISRASIAVQSETRDYMKQLVEIMTRNGGNSSGGTLDLGSLIFGEGGDVPAPQTVPGARRGPF